MEYIKKRAVFVVVAILVIHFVLSLVVARQESMTFDEKAHIPAAYSYVRYGDMRLNPEHPPLLKDLSGLFLLPLEPEFPLASPEWQEGYNEQWLVGDMFVNCSRPDMACNDADTILLFSRLPITILSVVLGLTIFLWTRKLGGALAGVFATTLYAFDPNIIAHNHYVTTDLGSAAFFFFAFYFFIEFLKTPSRKNILLAGLFLGLVELTKFSAVLLFPIFGLFVFLFALARGASTDRTLTMRDFLSPLWNYAWKFLVVVTLSFVVIWIGYALNTLGMPAEKVVAHADLFLSQPNAPAQMTYDLIVSMTASPLLLPLAEYFVGIAKVFSRVAAGNVHYYFGTVSTNASPSYFPVVFLLKETLPFLFLLLLTTLYGLYRIGRQYAREQTLGLVRFLSHSFQNKITQYLAVFFILFYSYVSITGNLTIGFRHLFPILPFLYMLVGKTLADIYKRHEHEPATYKLIGFLITLIMGAVVAVPVLSYPSYLSYFNAIGGGHEKGYLYVTDSNYDWGQDLKHLRKFVENVNRCRTVKHIPSECAEIAGYPAIDKIRVDYFGGSYPGYYLGDAYTSWWSGREPEAGWYAISTFFYQESLYKERAPGERSYEWLKNKTPLARAGDSFLIYYITEEDLLGNTQ